MGFKITTVDALTDLYPAPSEKAQHKRIPELTDSLMHKVAESSLCIIASVGEAAVDCSPRGDSPGQLVKVLDSKTLAIPDRPGSHRLDTAKNIIDNGKVSLWFLSAEWRTTVRVSGDAHISVDPTLLEQFALDGVLPVTVMVVTIKEVATHNDRAVKQSGLLS